MGKIKNLKMDQDFVNVMLNGEDFENHIKPGVLHFTLHDINRVESTMICMICKDSYVQQSQ